MTPEELQRLMERPCEIFSPDGTRFVVKLVMNDEATTPFDLANLIRYEVRGPGTGDHLWLAGWDGELIADPSDNDVPKNWTTKARIALQGWLRLNDEMVPE